MEKKTKKIVVNSLTLSRIAGTIIMPIMFNFIATPLFLLIIGLILLTDSIDGFLARRWDVCTIFGSLADQTGDKFFALALLIILTTMFPIMIVPLSLELFIAGINIKNICNNSFGKSSEIGRIKTWIMGLSIFSLLIVGLSPELFESLKKININTETFTNIINLSSNKISIMVSNLNNSIREFIQNTNGIKNNNLISDATNLSIPLNNIGQQIDYTINGFKSNIINITNNFEQIIKVHKKTITDISKFSSIMSESIVATNYLKGTIKNSINNSENNKSIRERINELKLNKVFIKSILFDEEYNKKTKNLSLMDKLTNSENKTLTKRK